MRGTTQNPIQGANQRDGKTSGGARRQGDCPFAAVRPKGRNFVLWWRRSRCQILTLLPVPDALHVVPGCIEVIVANWSLASERELELLAIRTFHGGFKLRLSLDVLAFGHHLVLGRHRTCTLRQGAAEGKVLRPSHLLHEHCLGGTDVTQCDCHDTDDAEGPAQARQRSGVINVLCVQIKLVMKAVLHFWLAPCRTGTLFCNDMGKDSEEEFQGAMACRRDSRAHAWDNTTAEALTRVPRPGPPASCDSPCAYTGGRYKGCVKYDRVSVKVGVRETFRVYGLYGNGALPGPAHLLLKGEQHKQTFSKNTVYYESLASMSRQQSTRWCEAWPSCHSTRTFGHVSYIGCVETWRRCFLIPRYIVGSLKRVLQWDFRSKMG